MISLSLEELLQIHSMDISSINQFSGRHKSSRDAAAKLYGREKNDILSLKFDKDMYAGEAVKKFGITFPDTEELFFYLKQCWENNTSKKSLIEASGIELLNLTSDKKRKYLVVGNDYILLEDVGSPLKYEISNDVYLKSDPKLGFQLGRMQEYARFLGLGDRNFNNIVRSSSGNFYHIDLERLHWRETNNYIKLMGWFNVESFNSHLDGRQDAKNEIKRNLQNNIEMVVAICNAVDRKRSKFSSDYYSNAAINGLRTYIQGEGWNFNNLAWGELGK